MSFRCEQCNEAQPQRSKPNVVVTEWYGGHDGSRQIKREKRLCDRCAGKDIKSVEPVILTPLDTIAVKLEIPG